MSEFISVVIPVLNEERHLLSCLDALSLQVPPDAGEIIVVDGRSSDRSCQIVRERMQVVSNLRLIDNPARLQSAGVNLAASQADQRSTVIVRADAHAAYSADFVARCVLSLRTHCATSVVVPMIARGETGFQQAAAYAQNHPLGNGGSSHRKRGRSGPVEHGHHAAFDRAFFLQLGGYDETFTHNEDAEHDVRALRAGGSLWMCAEAAITYFPRRSITSLFRQYRNHGAGRARTLLLHRRTPRLRQLAPLIILVGTCLSLASAPLALWPLLLPAFYGLVCCAQGVVAAVSVRSPWLLAAGPALMAMHFAWGVGFLSTVASRRRARHEPASTFRLRQRESS